MSAKAFAKSRRCQQAIDITLQSITGWILDKRLGIGSIGRQASQLEGEPADKIRRCGVTHWLKPASLQAAEHQSIDRTSRPNIVGNLSPQLGHVQRLMRPMGTGRCWR